MLETHLWSQIREKLDEARRELEAMQGSVVGTESDAQMRVQQLATKVGVPGWDVCAAGRPCSWTALIGPAGIMPQQALAAAATSRTASLSHAAVHQQGCYWCLPESCSWRWGCCVSGRASTKACLWRAMHSRCRAASLRWLRSTARRCGMPLLVHF